MKTSVFLKKVDRLFPNEDSWTQGAYKQELYRRSKNGKPQYVFCLVGAMQEIQKPLDSFYSYTTYDNAHALVAKAAGMRGTDLVRWNDSRTRVFSDIKKTLKKAIRLAEKAESRS